MCRVNETVELPELKFEPGADFVLAHHPAHLSDDFETVLDAALVVVSKIEDEKVLETELVVEHSLPHCLCVIRTAPASPPARL
jgi:hypothetical protein